jgi:hypothetical protein
MKCPVCMREAQNLTPNTLDGVVVGCDACGGYRISGGAYFDLMQLQVDQRVGVLESARRATRAGWPMIDAASLRAR